MFFFFLTRLTFPWWLVLNDPAAKLLLSLQNCGSPPPLQAPGPLTVFVPTNQAVDRARDGSILYMLTDVWLIWQPLNMYKPEPLSLFFFLHFKAKHKLQELLRHHVFSQAAVSIFTLEKIFMKEENIEWGQQGLKPAFIVHICVIFSFIDSFVLQFCSIENAGYLD